jgi:hypothetical protein
MDGKDAIFAGDGQNLFKPWHRLLLIIYKKTGKTQGFVVDRAGQSSAYAGLLGPVRPGTGWQTAAPHSGAAVRGNASL